MKTISVAALATVATMLGACTHTTPHWEKRFGDAARQARAAQTIDPDAPTRNTAQGPVDGKAVAGAQKAYAESYGYGVKEARPPVLTLGTTNAR